MEGRSSVINTQSSIYNNEEKKQMQLQDDDRRHLQNFEKFRRQLMIMKGKTSRESCARSCKVVRILRINDIASGEFQGLIYNMRWLSWDRDRVNKKHDNVQHYNIPV